MDDFDEICDALKIPDAQREGARMMFEHCQPIINAKREEWASLGPEFLRVRADVNA